MLVHDEAFLLGDAIDRLIDARVGKILAERAGSDTSPHDARVHEARAKLLTAVHDIVSSAPRGRPTSIA